ncbi:Mercuric resistance operon regulatory protein [Streptomyces sp. S4.7]|uniref:MerR family transcriptional regulator n=1 Tax=unclassified Streptomyces TaxID=2593676 RepID=UPI001398EC3D|nr:MULTISPECIES: MerR family transcriptional regulator [unclassified Streptomyces]QHZ00253.1 Mercuric resistance operon regulatory protein [Streptomyces sp. S4.7]
MKIGELARRTAVSERSLRYYEEQGLLASERTPSGHRTYPERAVDRVIRIQELFAAGLCSGKIAELLPCMRDEDGGPSEAATPWLVADLTRQRARIDQQIAELMRTREVLDDVITAAAGSSSTAGRPPARSGTPAPRAVSGM